MYHKTKPSKRYKPFSKLLNSALNNLKIIDTP